MGMDKKGQKGNLKLKCFAQKENYYHKLMLIIQGNF